MQVLSTGAPHLLVQAADRPAVDRAVPGSARLAGELRDVGGEGCYLYGLDPVEPTSTAYARLFNPTVGIDDGSKVLIERGHLIGRPSLVEIGVHGPRVTIAGACVIAAEGVLQL